jgi:DNA-binding Lrp family transcriptional regulator
MYYTTKQISKKYGIPITTLKNRFEKLKIEGECLDSKKRLYYSKEKLDLLWDYLKIKPIKSKKINNKVVERIVYIDKIEVIKTHTVYWIIESKINKKSAVYGTHKRNFNRLHTL